MTTDSDKFFYHGAPTPSCEYRDGMPCDPCNDLTEIVAQIADLQSKLKNLHEQLSQARVRRNHLHSPLIHQFPHEIVSRIFTLAFPPQGTPLDCKRADQRASPLPITKVCHTWRVHALSTARLWCDISIDGFRKPKFALLDHQLAYSGVAPLSIWFYPSTRDLSTTKQAMHWVVKQLHRTRSFCLTLPQDLVSTFDSVCDSDRPNAAPLLEELHVHSADRQLLSRLKLAIKPPRLRHAILVSITFDHVSFDWSNISHLTLEGSHVDGLLQAVLASPHLKQLVLWQTRANLPTGQALVVNRSIEHLTLGIFDSAEVILTMTSLPSLRKLEIHTQERHPLRPLLLNFLHRSLCPLQVLTIHDWAHSFESPIRILLDVLENTGMLQQLALRFLEDSLAWNFEPLVQRLSQDRGFLPHLQTICLETQFVPPISLLLDVMTTHLHSSNGSRPLNELFLRMWLLIQEVDAIPQDDLGRIFELRAAGKTVSITCSPSPEFLEDATDLVEYWNTDRTGPTTIISD